LRAAHRAADLALPLLKPGVSLRFALLPSGEDPDSLIRAQGSVAMAAALDGAMPLVEMIWRAETEGRAFDTPQRKAALIARFNDRLTAIASIDVRRFYLDWLAEKLSAALGLKTYVYNDRLHASGAARRKTGAAVRGRPGADQRRGFLAVSSAVKGSRLVPRDPGRPANTREDPSPIRIERPIPPIVPRQSAADPGARDPGAAGAPAIRSKESEVLVLILDNPEILEGCHETLAALPFSDRSLDSLRHELLNLAASGFRLETGSLEDHLVRAGMGALVGRLKTRRAASSVESGRARQDAERGGADAGEIEARWLRAAAQLRDLAEVGPERRQALERFKSEASEESWLDWHRLHYSGVLPNE
jgi:DNA primase